MYLSGHIERMRGSDLGRETVVPTKVFVCFLKDTTSIRLRTYSSALHICAWFRSSKISRSGIDSPTHNPQLFPCSPSFDFSDICGPTKSLRFSSSMALILLWARELPL
jgi:hypothetical protein